MLAVVSLLAVVTIGLTITRVATIVLTTTGLSRDVARFQARSAFTGVGFTTTEAESVVNHPVRRRVIMWLVLVGNAGIVTTVTSLLLSFNDATGGQTLLRTAVIVLGLFGLWLLAGSRVVDRAVHRATEWALRRYTKLELRDYDQLLHVTEDYAVIELEVRAGDWLTATAWRSSRCARRASSCSGSTGGVGASTSACPRATSGCAPATCSWSTATTSGSRGWSSARPARPAGGSTSRRCRATGSSVATVPVTRRSPPEVTP